MSSFIHRSVVEKHIRQGVFDEWLSSTSGGVKYDIKLDKVQSEIWVQLVADGYKFMFKYTGDLARSYSDNYLEHLGTTIFSQED